MAEIAVRKWEEPGTREDEIIYHAELTLIDKKNPLILAAGSEWDSKTKKMKTLTRKQPIREVVKIFRTNKEALDASATEVFTRMEEDITAGYPDRTPEPPKRRKEKTEKFTI